MTKNEPADLKPAEDAQEETWPARSPEDVQKEARLIEARRLEERKAEEEARLQAEQAGPSTEDEALAAVVGLARLNAVYYTSLRNQGVPDDVCKALTRDYAALSLSSYYGFKGVSLPGNE